jgi:DNA-binding XRE family transcriptional regulator
MTRDDKNPTTHTNQSDRVHDDDRVGPEHEEEARTLGDWLSLPWVEAVLEIVSLSPTMVEHLLATAPDVSLRNDAAARFGAAWRRGIARGQVQIAAREGAVHLASPGQVLSLARHAAALSTAAVATAVGIAEAAYVALEQDTKRLWEVLSPDQLLRLARSLSTVVDDFVEQLRFAAARLMLQTAHDRFAGGLPRLNLARGPQSTSASAPDDMAARLLRRENDMAGAFFAAIDKLRASNNS